MAKSTRLVHAEKSAEHAIACTALDEIEGGVGLTEVIQRIEGSMLNTGKIVTLVLRDLLSRDTDACLTIIAECVSKGLENAHLCNMRAGILHDLKRSEEALSTLDEAKEKGMENAASANIRAGILHDLKRSEEALSTLDEAKGKGMENAHLCNMRARILHDLKRSEEALSTLDEAKGKGMEDAHLCNMRAGILHDLKRSEEALSTLDEAKGKGMENAHLCNMRAGILHDLKRSEEALSTLDEAKGKGMEDAHLCNMRAGILHDLKRSEEALSTLDEAKGKGMEDAHLCNMRAGILHDLGRSAEAIETLRVGRMAYPHNAVLACVLGMRLAMVGDRSALPHVIAAMQKSSQPSRPLLFLLAECVHQRWLNRNILIMSLDQTSFDEKTNAAILSAAEKPLELQQWEQEIRGLIRPSFFRTGHAFAPVDRTAYRVARNRLAPVEHRQ
ncbi:tetratricopeptide repeat protein [Candidatus Peribacteria bacterium]|nr:tetratricopeptide repeat protein [Candidatus Peribacteria bacterium]